MPSRTGAPRGRPPVRASGARSLRDPLRIEVGQGAFEVSGTPGTALSATLGSCVAVCLHDPAHGVGGMNHIYHCLDPGPTGGGAIVAEVERLVNALSKLGSRRAGLRARIVGGAHVLLRGRDLGSDIAGVCLLYLAAEGIPVLECTTGGDRARRAMFEPVTGRLAVSYPGTALPPVRRPPRRPEEDWMLF